MYRKACVFVCGAWVRMFVSECMCDWDCVISNDYVVSVRVRN